MSNYTKLFLLITLFFSSLFYGQEEKDVTYRFLNSNVVSSTSGYENAMSTADMSAFRYKDDSSIIEFEGGLKIELFSANQLISVGKNVDMSKVLVSEPVNKNEYVFKLSSNGTHILRTFTRTEFKQK